MNEYLTMYQAGIAGLGLVAGSFMYSWGGRSGKWRRRFLASFILSCTFCGLMAWRGMWNWWFLATYPILSLGFSLGYGSDDPIEKIVKRAVYASAILMTGLLASIILGGKAWWVYFPHIGVGTFSIWLGTKNPIYAPAEEFSICMMLNMGLMLYPFVMI